ncbi:MAG: hypothetical protein ABIV10_02590 [Gemmatimonadaceae bacterium]
MTVTARTARPLAFALSLTVGLFMGSTSAQAQDVVRAAAPAATADSVAVAPSAAALTAPAGPTMDAAAVGVRHAPESSTTTAAPRGGYGQPVALMVVGGAALIAGLLIGGGAGTAIAIGGAVAGLIGLYQYMQ